jgi:hypothetical protein
MYTRKVRTDVYIMKKERQISSSMPYPTYPPYNPLTPTPARGSRWLLEGGGGFWFLESGAGYWLLTPN